MASDDTISGTVPQFDAISIHDEAFHPGQPWRVICAVVRDDGSVTGTTLTRYCESEEEAEEWIGAAGDEDMLKMQERFIHAMRHHAAEHRDCKHTVPHG